MIVYGLFATILGNEGANEDAPSSTLIMVNEFGKRQLAFPDVSSSLGDSKWMIPKSFHNPFCVPRIILVYLALLNK